MCVAHSRLRDSPAATRDNLKVMPSSGAHFTGPNCTGEMFYAYRWAYPKWVYFDTFSDRFLRTPPTQFEPFTAVSEDQGYDCVTYQQPIQMEGSPFSVVSAETVGVPLVGVPGPLTLTSAFTE